GVNQPASLAVITCAVPEEPSESDWRAPCLGFESSGNSFVSIIGLCVEMLPRQRLAVYENDKLIATWPRQLHEVQRDRNVYFSQSVGKVQIIEFDLGNG